MAHFCSIGFLLLLASCLLEALPRPINNEASIQYLPFYGGAKGQYLEVKKDTAGSVTSEKIVSEDKISSENILKNSDDNLLSKVFAANIQTLRTLSNNILKLHTLGRKTGLGTNEKMRLKNQLGLLGEAASNTIKLVEEIGENVDTLFKKNATQRRYEEDEDDEVGEEGIGIDSDGSSSSGFDPDEDSVAVAKPMGIAVIGTHGLAAARPIGTAVAASGVAIAGPVGTAIAGIDPTLLGLNLQIHHSG